MDVCSSEHPASFEELNLWEKINSISRTRTKDATPRYGIVSSPSSPLSFKQSPSPDSTWLPTMETPTSHTEQLFSIERKRNTTPTRLSPPSSPPTGHFSPFSLSRNSSPVRDTVSVKLIRQPQSARNATLTSLSLPSSPPARHLSPLSPSRTSTPVRDRIAGKLTRKPQRRRCQCVLWPSMHNLSFSFHSEYISTAANKDCSLYAGKALKCSGNMVSEFRKSPPRESYTTKQSENSKPVENSLAKMVDLHLWPCTTASKLSCSPRPVSSDVNVSGRTILGRVVSPTSRRNCVTNSQVDASRWPALDGSGIVDQGISMGTTSSSSIEQLTRKQPSLILHSSSPSNFSPVQLSVPRGMSSPGKTCPASPAPPSFSTISQRNPPLFLRNNVCDGQEENKGPSQIGDDYQLMLLYNRVMQWRFINAQVGAALSEQHLRSKDILFNMWSITSQLHDQVLKKKMDVELLRRKKLVTLVEGQVKYLEEWSMLEGEYNDCSLGMFGALRIATLHLPVKGGATADVSAIRNAISSSLDSMQAVGLSLRYLLSQADGSNDMVAELSNIVVQERTMLVECRNLLSSLARLQILECSLRVQLMQPKAGCH